MALIGRCRGRGTDQAMERRGPERTEHRQAFGVALLQAREATSRPRMPAQRHADLRASWQHETSTGSSKRRLRLGRASSDRLSLPCLPSRSDWPSWCWPWFGSLSSAPDATGPPPCLIALAAQNIRAYRRRGASEASPGGVNRLCLSDVAFVRRNHIPSNALFS